MLETVDLNKALSKAAYAKQMPALQERLRKLQYEANDKGVAITICLEGWDLSGKGHLIKKLTEKLDPRLFRIRPGSPPSPLEQRYHFLWRYQMALPNYGEMTLFDHSWYGRVLVERCDKLTKKKHWQKGYQQINEFERWLTDDRQVLLKFWLHISKSEQKKRFRETLDDPLLRWKITKEYRRHHRQYDRWVDAVEEMLAKTDSPNAPWTVIEASDLRWARVRFLRTIVNAVEPELARRPALAADKAGISPPKLQAERPPRAKRGPARARSAKVAHA
jgi:polyphosphate kinase 2 (PPK2 family)